MLRLLSSAHPSRIGLLQLHRPCPVLAPMIRRLFSSSNAIDHHEQQQQQQHIRILYGTQGGTAQMFGMQLQDALQTTQPESTAVSLMGLHENKPPDVLLPVVGVPPSHPSNNNKITVAEDAIHIFLISVAGVGEPPDNARAFYEYIMNTNSTTTLDKMRYTVFGLGNRKAHPNHYNVIGKRLDQRLQDLGATRVFPLGLGDDGECIEDDFDVWMEELVTSLQQQERTSGITMAQEGASSVQPVVGETVVAPVKINKQAELDSSTTTSARRVPDKYPTLTLSPPKSDVVRDDLLPETSTERNELSSLYYAPDVNRLAVADNRPLGVRSMEYGLRELTVSLPDHVTYEAGDHLVLYPRNSNCVTEAFLQLLDVDPHAVIERVGSSSNERTTRNRQYPFPTGISVMETLSHCVDLGAPPSPAFARLLLGRQDVSYKDEIVNPRRTVLDLALEAHSKLSLEEWLFNLPPMQPRFYSIASSPLAHPHDILLTYRPVKYVTSRGVLREGVCTSYMHNLGVPVDDSPPSHVVAAIRSNPTFRLPRDHTAPVLLIAGGCGIAPIRAFLEERLTMYNQGTVTQFGESHLFLGFRSPLDEVYQRMVAEATEKCVVSEAHVSYTAGCVTAEQNCRLVSDTLRVNGSLVWELFQRGGYAYLCGGARTFGAAIEREVMDVFQEQGNLSAEEATKYLQKLIKEGRFCEDLAD